MASISEQNFTSMVSFVYGQQENLWPVITAYGRSIPETTPMFRPLDAIKAW